MQYFLYNNLIRVKQNICFNLLLFLSGSGLVLSFCYGGVYVFTSKVLEPMLDVSIFFYFINKLSVFNYSELVVLVLVFFFLFLVNTLWEQYCFLINYNSFNFYLLFFSRNYLIKKAKSSKNFEVLNLAITPLIETSSNGCWYFQLVAIVAVSVVSLIGNRLCQKSQALEAAKAVSKLEEVAAGNLNLETVVPPKEVLELAVLLEKVTPIPYTGIPMGYPGSGVVGLQVIEFQAKIVALVESAALDLQRNCGHADVRSLFDLNHQSSWRPRQWWVYQQHVEYHKTLGTQYVREQLMHYSSLADMSFSEWLISHTDWKAGAAVLGLGVFNLFIQGLSQAFHGPDMQNFCKIPYIYKGLGLWKSALTVGRRLNIKTRAFLEDVKRLFYRDVLFDFEIFIVEIRDLVDYTAWYLYPTAIIVVTALLVTYSIYQ